MGPGAGKAGTASSTSPGAVMGAGASVAAAAGVVRARATVSAGFGDAVSTRTPARASIPRAALRPTMGMRADVSGGE